MRNQMIDTANENARISAKATLIIRSRRFCDRALPPAHIATIGMAFCTIGLSGAGMMEKVNALSRPNPPTTGGSGPEITPFWH